MSSTVKVLLAALTPNNAVLAPPPDLGTGLSSGPSYKASVASPYVVNTTAHVAHAVGRRVRTTTTTTTTSVESVTNLQQPHLQVQQPVVQAGQPVVLQVQQPIVRVQHPVVQLQRQVIQVQQPIVQVQQPRVQMQQPVMQQQFVQMQRPMVAVQQPVAQITAIRGHVAQPVAYVQNQAVAFVQQQPVVRRDGSAAMQMAAVPVTEVTQVVTQPIAMKQKNESATSVTIENKVCETVYARARVPLVPGRQVRWATQLVQAQAVSPAESVVGGDESVTKLETVVSSPENHESVSSAVETGLVSSAEVVVDPSPSPSHKGPLMEPTGAGESGGTDESRGVNSADIYAELGLAAPSIIDQEVDKDTGSVSSSSLKLELTTSNEEASSSSSLAAVAGSSSEVLRNDPFLTVSASASSETAVGSSETAVKVAEGSPETGGEEVFVVRQGSASNGKWREVVGKSTIVTRNGVQIVSPQKITIINATGTEGESAAEAPKITELPVTEEFAARTEQLKDKMDAVFGAFHRDMDRRMRNFAARFRNFPFEPSDGLSESSEASKAFQVVMDDAAQLASDIEQQRQTQPDNVVVMQQQQEQSETDPAEAAGDWVCQRPPPPAPVSFSTEGAEIESSVQATMGSSSGAWASRIREQLGEVTSGSWERREPIAVSDMQQLGEVSSGSWERREPIAVSDMHNAHLVQVGQLDAAVQPLYREGQIVYVN